MSDFTVEQTEVFFQPVQRVLGTRDNSVIKTALMIVLLTGWPEEVKTLFSGTITWLVWMLRQIGKGEQPTRTQL